LSRQQLTFEVAAAAVPRAEALLELAGAETISLRDAADNPVLEPEPNTAPLWPAVIVSAQFPIHCDLEALREVLRMTCAATCDAVRRLDLEDWQAGLRQTFAARPFGERLWLAPAEGAPAPPGRIGIRLHMGFAFGTGEHPTTALCLDWLDSHVTSGATLVDYGCGSGVLAIAALALGADRAFAIDNDPQALAATRANAALNDFQERCFIGMPDQLPRVAADIVVANILAEPLLQHARLFATSVLPGGALVLSGILETQVERVAAAYEGEFAGFAVARRDGWARLSAFRHAS
jgi:ribosomal protein L11 methyltransferase